MSAGALDGPAEPAGTGSPGVAAGAVAAGRTPALRRLALFRLPTVVTGVLVLLWFAAGAGLRPLMLPDEGRYVGVAWEMLRSGDWLTPTLDGLPYFHKPPLFYWITAASMSVFGAHEWAARAAPILGATLGTIALHGLARRWASERQARATLVALLAQPMFFLGAQFANLDMLVAGCITATIVLLADAALCVEHGRPARGVLAGAYVTAALGVLAKGLIGFVLPALAIGVWLLARGRGRGLVRLWWWPGAALFVVVVAPWFLAMQERFPGFLHYFFVVQHFQRFAGAGFNNVQPFWFYPAVLVLCCLPWTPWLLRGLRWPRKDLDGLGAIRLLMAVWIGVVVLFFSWPASKLVGYVLPAVPPLAFLLADAYVRAPATTGARRLWVFGAVLAMVPNLAVVAWLATHPLQSSRGLAMALREHRRAGEPVLMLEQYPFDLPFYAGLRAPVLVVDDWSSVEIDRHDNWRKELADAARLASPAARSVLLEPAELTSRLCAESSSWLLGAATLPARYPFLAAAEALRSDGGRTLWRVDARAPTELSALGCSGTPSAGSAGR